jgi:hypothetical protein
MNLKLSNIQPSEPGHYVWKAPSGIFYLAEVCKDRKGRLYAFGCGAGAVYLNLGFGGVWSEKLELET